MMKQQLHTQLQQKGASRDEKTGMAVADEMLDHVSGGSGDNVGVLFSRFIKGPPDSPNPF